MKHAAFTFILSLVFISTANATVPEVGKPLPTLDIAERGELVIKGDDFGFEPWTSAMIQPKVHVIQYFGAKLSHRDIFSPFTDLLQKRLPAGTVHVTTILNLDAALWGTSGMVLNELKKSKTQHPEAAMVVDEDGVGVNVWSLGKAGTGLIILDARGTVKFFSPGALTGDALESAIKLIEENL